MDTSPATTTSDARLVFRSLLDDGRTGWFSPRLAFSRAREIGAFPWVFAYDSERAKQTVFGTLLNHLVRSGMIDSFGVGKRRRIKVLDIEARVASMDRARPTRTSRAEIASLLREILAELRRVAAKVAP